MIGIGCYIGWMSGISSNIHFMSYFWSAFLECLFLLACPSYRQFSSLLSDLSVIWLILINFWVLEDIRMISTCLSNEGSLQSSVVLVWNSELTTSLPFLCLLYFNLYKPTCICFWVLPLIVYVTSLLFFLTFIILHSKLCTLPSSHMLRQSLELICTLSLTRWLLIVL